jgi:predicted small lipoprotein YifL
VPVLAIAIAALAGCGRKGPPLPPLRPAPDKVTEVSVRRLGSTAEIRFRVPSKNADSPTAVSVARIDVFAVTLPGGAARPTIADLMMKAFIVGSIAVRPELPPDAPLPEPVAGAAIDTRPAPGDVATFKDTIPATTKLPSDWPPSARRARGLPTAPSPPFDLLRGPVGPPPPARYYVLQPVSENGRPGVPIDVLAVPLTPAPRSPGAPDITYDETTLRIAWRSAILTTYRIYAADAKGVETTGVPLNIAVLTTGEFKAPVVFGTEKCFVVRAVVTATAISVESDPASPPACVKAVDTFPPAAPTGLSGAPANEGATSAISLTWNPVDAPDLAGYIVLRSVAPDENMTQLSRAPVTLATYRDETVKAGVTYFYKVIAVDKANNPSAQSSRFEVTARVP